MQPKQLPLDLFCRNISSDLDAIRKHSPSASQSTDWMLQTRPFESLHSGTSEQDTFQQIMKQDEDLKNLEARVKQRVQ